MSSGAPSVAGYIAHTPTERHDALELLRRLCREGLPGFEETIRYGMPCYTRDDVVEIAFASQKQYISFYVMRESVLRGSADRLGELSVGKGCIRFRRPDQIDPGLIRDLLRATTTDTGPVC